MSDATDELDFWGRQLLKQSQLNPLREKMREFISEHPADTDLRQLREQTRDGTDLSSLVDEGREERL